MGIKSVLLLQWVLCGKWFTKSSITSSPGTWYLLHLWKNAPRHSLLTAKSTFYRRVCGYSIVVEVTCHFQTFSTEQDWTALAGELHKKPPDWLSSASDLGAAHPGLCWDRDLPIFFLPSGSRCSVWQFHFNCLHLPFPIVKVTFQQNLMTLHL